VANEAFARVYIDQLLRDADWKLTDGQSVRYEPLDGVAMFFDEQGKHGSQSSFASTTRTEPNS